MALTLLVGLAGCAEEPVATDRALTGPVSNDLVVTTPAECPRNQVAPGDEVVVSGFDYRPGAVVTLRWTVKAREETGTWPSVEAERSGEFTATLPFSRTIAGEGERVTVSAEGAGLSGLMVLAATIDVGEC